MRRSEAILATSLLAPTPTEIVRPVAARTRARNPSAIAVTSATSIAGCSTVRSTYASSSDIGSTSGDSSRASSMTRSDTTR